jgi:hypothetical protein
VKTYLIYTFSFISILFLFHSSSIPLPFLFHSSFIPLPFLFHSSFIPLLYLFHSSFISLSFLFHIFSISLSFIHKRIINFILVILFYLFCLFIFILLKIKQELLIFELIQQNSIRVRLDLIVILVESLVLITVFNIFYRLLILVISNSFIN